MRRRKNMLLCFMVLMAVLILGGCGRSKKINEDGFKITLTDDFRKKEQEGTDWYYESPDVVVSGVAVPKNALEISGHEVNSLKDYAVIYRNANTSDDKEPVEIRERNQYLYMEYQSMVNQTGYSHMTGIYEEKDAYYVVTFTCYESLYKDIMKDRIFAWADSVSFEETENSTD